MSRVLGDTFVAPRLFVSTLPPVEASGTLMLLPYAIGFAAAAACRLAGARDPAAVAPAVPLVAALGATIPVAVLVPDHYIARGASSASCSSPGSPAAPVAPSRSPWPGAAASS